MKIQDLKNAFQEPPQHFSNMVGMTLNNLGKEEKIKMKKMTFKKGLVFAVLTVLAFSTTALASGKVVSFVSRSSKNHTYKSFPTAEILAKDIEVMPQLVQEFENGFVFSSGNLSKDMGVDESRNVVVKYNSVILEYVKGTEKILLSINKTLAAQGETQFSDSVQYKDITLGYLEVTAKFVPEGYVMTPQDKENVESGKYIFNDGSNGDVVEQNVQSVEWQKDGVSYCLIAQDCSLEKAEILAMAQEIINA